MKQPIIETNLAFEFTSTIMGLAYYDKKEHADEDKSISRFNHYSSDFVKTIAPKIPRFVLQDIRLYFRDFSCFYITMLDTLLKENIKTPEEFINYFKSLTTRQFLNLYLESNETGLTCDSDHETLVQSLDELTLKLHKYAADKELFFQFEKYPKDVVSRLTNALNIVYEDFFKPNEDELIADLLALKLRHQQLFNQDPDAFINAILFQSKESLHEQSATIYIFASLLYGDKVTVAYDNDKNVYFFYGQQAEKKIYNDDLTLQYEELLKSLADDTRRKLIRYLMNNPHYNKEISDYLGITTATISYHIGRLTDLGIIQLKYQEGKRIYYQVDKERFNQLFDGLKRHLTSI